MTPWEIVEYLRVAEDPSEILSKLDPADPFWVGASYALDPFIGKIYRLAIRRDPTTYGPGLPTKLFIEAVDAIIAGKVTGDNLAKAVEAISRTCQAEEWLFWYKPILQGDLDIPISFSDFNKHCPETYAIRPIKLHNPKLITSLTDLPERFFIQPEYDDERVFWMIDSRYEPIEIRCYDSRIRRVYNDEVQASLLDMARKHPYDIVLFGHMGKQGFLVDDILTREQFAQEGGAQLLHKRLMATAALGIQPVQMSGLMTSSDLDRFYKELDLIFQQGYKGAVLRNLDGHYPFRVQSDVLVSPATKTIMICKEVLPGIGIKAEVVRGKKTTKADIRLGLTETAWKDISELSIGRRLDVLSCGQKNGELVLPMFCQWR